MTIDQAAVALGILPATLKQYISIGRFPKRADGTIDPPAVISWKLRQASAIARRKLTYISPRRTVVD